MITLTKSPLRNKYIWYHYSEVLEPMSKSVAIAKGIWCYKIPKEQMKKAIDLLSIWNYDIVLFGIDRNIMQYRKHEELFK